MRYINADMEIVFFEDLDVIATSDETTFNGGLVDGGVGEGDSGKFDDLFPNL